MKTNILKAFWVVTLITIMAYFIGMMPLMAGGHESLYPIWIPMCFNVLQFILLITLVITYVDNSNKKSKNS